VPVLLASAGVQRIVAVAYVLVWAWFEHLANSDTIRKSPQRRLVFLIDEVEAHLHPRWQRVIVPALTDVINLLSAEITPKFTWPRIPRWSWLHGDHFQMTGQTIFTICV